MFNFYKINKRFSKAFYEYEIMEYSLNRKHPVVFNLYDNYCYICNLKLTILSYKDDIVCMSVVNIVNFFLLKLNFLLIR